MFFEVSDMGTIFGFEDIEIYISDGGFLVIKQDSEVLQQASIISIPLVLLDLFNNEIKRVVAEHEEDE